jgi:hypothetical protein
MSLVDRINKTNLEQPSREPGYYWITWTKLADEDWAQRHPGPLVSEWDGKRWWITRSDVYRFDCEVQVLGSAFQGSTATT